MLTRWHRPRRGRVCEHRFANIGSLPIVALSILCPSEVLVGGQQTQACDVTQFQGTTSSIGSSYPASSCPTCVFPSWQAVTIDTTKILQLDLTRKWVYMLGDSTTSQLHEQLLSYLDEPQVRLSVLLALTSCIIRTQPTQTCECSMHSEWTAATRQQLPSASDGGTEEESP